MAARYHELLDGAPHLALPPRPSHEDGHAWHLYPLAVDFPALGETRGDVIRALMARGIGTQVHYTPLYRQPYYRVQGHTPLSGAEQYYAQTLSIPMYPEISDADVAEIADAIREVIAP